MDTPVGIIQVAVTTTSNGRQKFDVSCSDGVTRTVWDAGLANSLNAFAGTGQQITIRWTETQKTGNNGQVYNNRTITAFAPPGQALPPEAAGGGPGGGGGGGGFRGRGGGMTPADKTRISKMGAQGSAAVLIASLFQGAGPEAYDEATALHDKLTLKLYKSARSHESEADIKGNAGPDGATVLQPGGTATLPAGATAQDVAAVTPGVVVGTQALASAAPTDAAAVADVAAQAAAEAPDDIQWD